jgi:transcriptional regulator with XRE-family HTH domain
MRRQARMSLTDVSRRTGISRAQISLIENGKVDPRISTVVKLLTCYGRSLGDLEPRPAEIYTIEEVQERARAGARRLAAAGLGPSDPRARLARKEARQADVEAEREALATRR